MSFFVDIVTEDSFYDNLTLGVVKNLESFPYVKNVRVERRNGCEATAITSWEQRHCCMLPEDIRNFYASIDGFLLQWDLEIAGKPRLKLSMHSHHPLCQPLSAIIASDPCANNAVTCYLNFRILVIANPFPFSSVFHYYFHFVEFSWENRIKVFISVTMNRHMGI